MGFESGLGIGNEHGRLGAKEPRASSHFFSPSRFQENITYLTQLIKRRFFGSRKHCWSSSSRYP